MAADFDVECEGIALVTIKKGDYELRFSSGLSINVWKGKQRLEEFTSFEEANTWTIRKILDDMYPPDDDDGDDWMVYSGCDGCEECEEGGGI